MRKIILLLIISTISISIFSTEQNMSIKEFTVENNIPFKKLMNYLDNGDNLTSDMELKQIGLSTSDLESIIADFRVNERSYLLGVTGMGMLIVFLSLILISIIISLLKYLNVEKPTKSSKDESLKANSLKVKSTGTGDLSPGVLASIAATISLHEMETAEANRLIMTINRESGFKLWKSIKSMPNAAYNARRKY